MATPRRGGEGKSGGGRRVGAKKGEVDEVQKRYAGQPWLGNTETLLSGRRASACGLEFTVVEYNVSSVGYDT